MGETAAATMDAALHALPLPLRYAHRFSSDRMQQHPVI